MVSLVKRFGSPALLSTYYICPHQHMCLCCTVQVMADEGVIAPLSQYVQVYLNGQFYGLYGMIEKVCGGRRRVGLHMSY